VTLAYLINQYPAPSQSFIRREILALESGGLEVRRFGMRRWDGELVDAGDRSEQSKTRYVLDAGALGLALSVLARMLRHPLRFARAFGAALRIGKGSSRGVLLHLVYFAEACVLARWLERAGIRHVHSHFGTNSTTVALLCRYLGGPPFSFTLHGPEEFDEPLGWALGEKAKEASFVAAISEFTRSQLYRWTDGKDWPKIHVVRCGVDQAFLAEPADLPPAAPRLVSIGRLGEQKGHLVLVDAVARLAREGVPFELTLVGDGPMRASVERRIAEHGLDGRVRISGWKSNDEVRAALRDARALVLPSFAEGLPVAFMEALALGRPVVTTFVGGIPELVEPGVTGWLVPAGAVLPLADAIREVLTLSPEELARLGRAGAEKVRARHDARREAEKLRGLFSGTGGSRGEANRPAP
jgi:glycosyltransferase involved in cell wall biosynthesis